jgi:hypothetical protein
MKRSNQNIRNLREASDALHYELSMLRFGARALASGIFGECRTPIRNALIESFASHARVLIDFFYSENPQNDDIIAQHFFSPPNKWAEIRPPKSETLAEAKMRANKLLAHLTYTRLKENTDKRWPVTEIIKDLEKVLHSFSQNVPTEHLGSRWKTNSL